MRKGDGLNGFALEMKRNASLYVMLIPAVVGFIAFHYAPMLGAIISFKQYNFVKGIWGSPWVGLKHFETFFNGMYFWRLLKNTLLLGLYSLLFGFWPPILFSLLLNELKGNAYKRIVQTISYLPHFIAMVVVVGMMMSIMSPTGLLSKAYDAFGARMPSFFSEPRYFRPMYIISGIWQNVGYSSIIYLAAITGIDPQLYEAAIIDGANRLQRAAHVTIPGILSVVTLLLVIDAGKIINVGFEKVFLLQNSATYTVSDIIQTYVYRQGVTSQNFSYATAIGLFNSAVAFVLVCVANAAARAMQQNSLW